MALIKLNELVRNRGLNLQSAKTQILDVESAKIEIDGAALRIATISADIKKELLSLGMTGSVGATLRDLDRYVVSNPDAPPLDTLERAFTQYFILCNEKFNKTLFHYLLTRLGRLESAVAVNYCLSAIRSRPEETEHIIRYFSRLAVSVTIHSSLLEYMESSDAIYCYQLYEIIKWFYQSKPYPSRVLRLCRTWAFDRNMPACLRAYARAILGDAASPDDLEAFESKPSQASDSIEKMELLLGLLSMEPSRRNAVLARYKDDGFLINNTIKYIKQSATANNA